MVVINGRYEIVGKLGSGGMATVHRALDRELEREVALKIVAEHLADDTQFLERFKREAKAAAKLDHENVVDILTTERDERTGRPFIVMEYVPGQSVAELLAANNHKLPLQEALWIIRGARLGLAHAHERGVVHRDVKPANLLCGDRTVKLTDFGIAKAIGASDLTSAGNLLGTAAYLSPEQARGKAATVRSDQYSLAVVAYQIVAGRLPYEGGTAFEIAAQQEGRRPPLLSDLDPEVPRPFATAVERSLAFDPDRRFASVDEFGQAVDEATGAKRTRAAGARRIEPRPPTVKQPVAVIEAKPGLSPVQQILHEAFLSLNESQNFRMVAGMTVVAGLVVGAVLGH